MDGEVTIFSASMNVPAVYHAISEEVFPDTLNPSPSSASLSTRYPLNCRIHHVTASMTTIDLIIKPRTELLEPVTTLFKLAAPSISSCALSIYFSQLLPLLLFSSYPLPTLTMDHIPLSKCGGLWTFVYPPCMQNAMASEVLYGLIRQSSGKQTHVLPSLPCKMARKTSNPMQIMCYEKK